MQVLLVGNMGLYDYRPYVKRIKNDRQIIFVCEKGFKLKLGKAQLNDPSITLYGHKSLQGA